MSNIITGLIAILMAAIFYLFYAYRLHSPVLWLILVCNLGALIYDYYMSIKEGEDNI
ncbi:MAG: hypothetical protein RBS34_12135 [Desulfofustis sp.]|jgi:4-hydroxybenzoate polyprenyltransferase|nr:hypothetical protein [Desulfofustis sp.]